MPAGSPSLVLGESGREGFYKAIFLLDVRAKRGDLKDWYFPTVKMDEVRLARWLVAESACHLLLFNPQTYAKVKGNNQLHRVVL